MIRHTANAPALPVARQHVLTDHYAALLRQLPESRGAAAVVGVTSSARREGVSTVAANLAITAAQFGDQDVLLVDANPRYSSLPRHFGVTATEGFSSLVTASSSLDELILPSGQDRLWLLPAGPAIPVLSHNEELSTCWAPLRERFDLVVFDLPVADEITPCLTLAASLDGVLLVVEAERRRPEAAVRAKQRLEQSGATLLGAVFNKQR